VSLITAIASNLVEPSEIALKIATLSAHTVRPKDAFSILQPVNIFPSVQRTAAPTLNLE